MSYTNSYYHFVIGTYRRREVLDLARQEELFAYMVGVLKGLKSYTFAIGGYRNHIHMAIDLHPTLALSNLVKDLKLATSLWIKTNSIFEGFDY